MTAVVDTVLVVLDLNHQIVEDSLQPLLMYLCSCQALAVQFSSQIEDSVHQEIVRGTEKIVRVYSKLRQLEVLMREFFEIIHMHPKEMALLFSCDGISNALEDRLVRKTANANHHFLIPLAMQISLATANTSLTLFRAHSCLLLSYTDILFSFSAIPTMQAEPLLKLFQDALKPDPTKQPISEFDILASFCCMYIRCIKADQHTSPKLVIIVEQLFEQVQNPVFEARVTLLSLRLAGLAGLAYPSLTLTLSLPQVVDPLVQGYLHIFEDGEKNSPGEKRKLSRHTDVNTATLAHLKFGLKLDLELENLYQDCHFWIDGSDQTNTQHTQRTMDTMRLAGSRLIHFSRSVTRFAPPRPPPSLPCFSMPVGSQPLQLSICTPRDFFELYGEKNTGQDGIPNADELLYLVKLQSARALFQLQGNRVEAQLAGNNK